MIFLQYTIACLFVTFVRIGFPLPLGAWDRLNHLVAHWAFHRIILNFVNSVPVFHNMVARLNLVFMLVHLHGFFWRYLA